MDDELLQRIYHYLFPFGMVMHTTRCQYADSLIELIELFRVAANLSARQALKRSRWPLWTRRLSFPSYSQFNRRVRTAAVQEKISQMSAQFRGQLGSSTEKACDGKPLLVGGFSKDPDAKTGKAPGGWAKGYKLHAIVDATGAVDAWQVTALSANEGRTAIVLVGQCDVRGAIVRGDGNYDCVDLYTTTARAGGRFIAPRRRAGTGLSKNCRQHPHRLQAIQELERCPADLKKHDLHRIRIEQIFGHVTNLSFGIWALPPSVRRIARVTRWINAKIALYHTHLCCIHRYMAA